MCKSPLTTFQIDVAVNAPEAGIIKELLVNEEDTVTVGQDLAKLELGGSPEGAEKASASSEPKEADQSTSPEPKPSKKDDSALSPPAEEKKSEPPVQEQPKKESVPKQTESKAEPKKTEPKPSSSAPTLGNREERRVGVICSNLVVQQLTDFPGQNESDASTNC